MYLALLDGASYKDFVYLKYSQNISHHHQNKAHFFFIFLSWIYTKLDQLVGFPQHDSPWYFFFSQFHVKYTKIVFIFRLRQVVLLKAYTYLHSLVYT